MDSSTIYSNQLRQRETSNINSSINVLYSTPLSKTTGLRVGHTVEFTKESNFLRPFNNNASTGKYIDLIDSINSGIDRKLWRNTTTAGLSWRKKKLSISTALHLLSLSYNNNYLKSSSVNKSFTYLYPTINVDVNSMRFSYSAFLLYKLPQSIFAPGRYSLSKVSYPLFIYGFR